MVAVALHINENLVVAKNSTEARRDGRLTSDIILSLNANIVTQTLRLLVERILVVSDQQDINHINPRPR